MLAIQRISKTPQDAFILEAVVTNRPCDEPAAKPFLRRNQRSDVRPPQQQNNMSEYGRR